MGTRMLTGLGAALFFVLASCSESGLLTPLRGQSSGITLKSVANGTMVASGDQIPLSVDLSSSRATPTILKVELLSPSGAVVQSADIKNADFSVPLPSVLLSNLQSGSYTLSLTLDGVNGEVLAQKKVNIFYVQGTYRLDGITSYPPALPPGGSGLIVARITAPEGSNPYLRWRMGDKLIAKGYLKEGLDKIQWNAPSSTGVYSITVEMFPFGPPSGSSFDFSSPYKMKVEVFVTTSARSGRNELGPKESYYALYHFQGNLKDSSGSGRELDAAPIGHPTLSVNGSVFGYQLDGSSGFKVSSVLLPFGSNGAMQPASVTMRLRLDKVQANRQFFSASTDDGSFKLDLSTNDKGLLAVSVNGTAEEGSIKLTGGDITSITLSLIPSDGTLGLLWFVNGRLVLSDSLAVDPKITSSAGVSTIGGKNGFTGMIDEFGVYYRDTDGRRATDPEVFRRAMMDEYGSNLVFAEGFDGIYLPSDVSYTGKVTRDQLVAGMLSLTPGQSVVLRKTAIGENDLTVIATVSGLSATASGFLTLSLEGKPLYSVALKDALVSAGRAEIRLSPVAGGGLKVILKGSKSTAITGKFSHIDVSLSSAGTTPLSVRSLLIIKKRARLTNRSVTGLKTAGPET